MRKYDNVKGFCKSLRRMRRAQNLTQSELGEKVGMTGKQVQKLESGLVKPSLADALVLAGALGSTVDAMEREGLSDAEQ